MMLPDLVDEFTYTIITNKVATLKELKNDYDIDDYLTLYDIAITQVSNKANLYKQAQKKHGRQ